MGHLAKTTRTKQLKVAIRPVVEEMEKRQMLSVTFTDGTLAIVGTEAADTIEISASSGQKDRMVVTVNGESQLVRTSKIKRIQVDALGGDDYVGLSGIAGGINIPATLLGGEGNDTLAGGLGADSLEGGLGHDFLNGGDGNDVLNGGDGKDRILGGEGNDTINGGAGNDAVSTDLYADDTNDVILKSKGKDTLNAQATPNFPISTFTGDIEAYEPSQMRRAYGFGDLDDPTYTNRGKGQAIAIVDAFHSPTARADLIRFSKEFGLPLPTKKTFVQTYASGKRPTEDMGWTGETLLDIQWAHAIAPQATIILVEADSALQGDIAAAITTATKLLNKWFGGGVISLSLGSAETATSRVRDSLFNNRNTKNISFVVAAGDTPEPSWPATNPNVLSVGGTSLFLDQYGNRVGGTNVTTWISDAFPNGYTDLWEDTGTVVTEGPVLGGERPWDLGGGGPSLIYPEPAYQQNLGANYPILDPATGETWYARGTPDIAWAASPVGLVHYYTEDATGGDADTGSLFDPVEDFPIGGGAVAVFNSYGDSGRSGWFATGGTSAGAPQVAAMVALANQYRADRKLSKIGNKLVDWIYRLGLKGQDQYFHDISQGGIGYDTVTQTWIQPAYRGWDYASGFGSPNAATLIPALAGEKIRYTDTTVKMGGMVTTFDPTADPSLGKLMSYFQFKGDVKLQGFQAISMSPLVGTVYNPTSSVAGSAISNSMRIWMYGADVSDDTYFTDDWTIQWRNRTPITLYRHGDHVTGIGRWEITNGNTTGGNNGNTSSTVYYGYFKFDGTIKGKNDVSGTFYSVDENGKAIKNVFTPNRFKPNSEAMTYIRGTIN